MDGALKTWLRFAPRLSYRILNVPGDYPASEELPNTFDFNLMLLNVSHSELHIYNTNSDFYTLVTVKQTKEEVTVNA